MSPVILSKAANPSFASAGFDQSERYREREEEETNNGLHAHMLKTIKSKYVEDVLLIFRKYSDIRLDL